MNEKQLNFAYPILEVDKHLLVNPKHCVIRFLILKAILQNYKLKYFSIVQKFQSIDISQSLFLD